MVRVRLFKLIHSTLSQFGADYGWQTFFTNEMTRGVQFKHTRTTARTYT